MTKGKKKTAAMQALLDMQNDGGTVEITVGEKTLKSNWTTTDADSALGDDDYVGYLTNNHDIGFGMSNDSDSIEYNDMEVEDTFLD